MEESESVKKENWKMSKNIALQSFVWAETKNIELSSWLVLHFCIFQLKHKHPSS